MSPCSRPGDAIDGCEEQNGNDPRELHPEGTVAWAADERCESAGGGRLKRRK